MLTGTFALILLAKKFDDSIPDEIDDPLAHAFDNWFTNASTGAIENEKDIDPTVRAAKEEEASSEEVGDVKHLDGPSEKFMEAEAQVYGVIIGPPFHLLHEPTFWITFVSDFHFFSVPISEFPTLYFYMKLVFI